MVGTVDKKKGCAQLDTSSAFYNKWLSGFKTGY